MRTIRKGLLTVAGACHIKAASQNKDELTGIASDDINASFTVHMKDFYEIPLLWGFIVNLFLHPVSHTVRNFLDQVPILNNKVIHALGIGSRRSKPGCFKKLTDLFFRYQFIAKIPDAPALTEKFQRRIRVQHGTGDGIHLSLRAAGIVKGPRGAHSDAVTAGHTGQVIDTDRAFGIHFQDTTRADLCARAAPRTFFFIDCDYSCHLYTPQNFFSTYPKKAGQPSGLFFNWLPE